MLLAVLILFALSAPFMSSTSALYKASTSSPIPAATVYLAPNRIQGTNGTIVSIAADITDVTGLFGWSIGLVWSNTTAVECTGVQNGSLLDPYGVGTYVFEPGAIDNTAGIASVYTWSLYSTDTPPTITGSGGLVIFSFKMLATGYSDVHINSMFMINESSDTIPQNIVDYTTIVRGGNQYQVRLQGNPIDSYVGAAGAGAAGFSGMRVTSPTEHPAYAGNMTFLINGTSDDVSSFAYFNATIPNVLMNSTSPATWIVDLNGVPQSGVLVSTGTQNTTISLSTSSDSDFAYSSYASGTVSSTITILSTYVAVPEFASTFSMVLLAALLVFAAFTAALITTKSRSRKQQG